MDRDIMQNLSAMVEQSLVGIQSVAEVGMEYKDYFCSYDAEDLVYSYFKIGRLVSYAKWEKEYQDRVAEKANASVIDYDSIPEPTKITNSYEINSGVISLEFSSSSLSDEQTKQYKNYVAQYLVESNSNTSNPDILKKAIASFEDNKSLILSEINEFPEKCDLPETFKANILEKALASKTITEKGKTQLDSIKPFVSFASEEGMDIYMNSIKDGSKVFTKDAEGNRVEISKASFNILGGQVEVTVEDSYISKINPKSFLQTVRQNNA